MGTNKYDDVRELLDRVHTFLSNLCRDARCDDHCSECIGASDLADDVYDLLHGPRRNCDVGTPEEQSKRYDEFCDIHDCRSDCPLFKADSCELAWAQMTYEEQEGEGDGR